MVVIRESADGRFEVYAAGRHWEAFEGTLGVMLVAQALAGQIAAETEKVSTIETPWGKKLVEPPRLTQVEIFANPLQLTVDPEPVSG